MKLEKKTCGCIAAACAMAACSPAHNWREVQPESSGLVAMFPCKPKSFERQVMLAGSKVTMRLISCSVEGTVYALAHAALDDPARVTPALAELRTAAAANIGGHPTELGALAVDGMTPNPLAQKLAIQGRAADDAAVQEQAGFFAKGMQVYQATIVGPEIDGHSADTFFSGLRFVS